MLIVCIVLILQIFQHNLFAAAAIDTGLESSQEQRRSPLDCDAKTKIQTVTTDACLKMLQFFDCFFEGDESISGKKMVTFFLTFCAEQKALWDELMDSLTEEQEAFFKDILDHVKGSYLIQPSSITRPVSKLSIRKSLQAYTAALLSALG